MEGVKMNIDFNDLYVELRFIEKRFVDKDYKNIVNEYNNNVKNVNNDVDYEYDDLWLIWKDMVKF